MLRGMSRSACWFALVLFASACNSVTSTGNAPPASNAPSPESASAKPDEEDPTEAIAALKREFEEARIELRSTELSVEDRRLDSAHQIEKAQRGVEAAQRALELFAEWEVPLQVDSAKLEVDRDRGNLLDQRAELAELEAMYAAEEFAKTTKELVIQRGRRHVAHAERDLELTERRLRQEEIAREHRRLELTHAVRDAEFELRGAGAEAEKLGLDLDLELRRARQKIEDVERKLRKKIVEQNATPKPTERS